MLLFRTEHERDAAMQDYAKTSMKLQQTETHFVGQVNDSHQILQENIAKAATRYSSLYQQYKVIVAERDAAQEKTR